MLLTRHLLESMCSIVAIDFILMACVELRLCDAGTVVDAYRLFQYDISGAHFGSRLAALNHHASSLHFAPGADISRSVLIIVNSISLLLELIILRNHVAECIAQRQPLSGLLFLFPQMLSRESKGGIGSNHLAREKELVKTALVELELLLMHANVPYPVYFAFENDSINSVLVCIKRDDVTNKLATAITGGYKVVVSTPKPKKVASPIITNIQGWLQGLKTDGDTSQLPTIAIVTSYDTFGTAPALSVGRDSSGNGVVALLEIARLFSILYSNPKTRGRYNILFGLTSGGPYNYDGTQKGLSHVAESLGVGVGLKHKKINISNARVAWEHEQFSRMRVTAATISGLSVAPKLLESSGGLSNSRGIYIGLQAKNIEIFAERSSLALNPYYVRSWLNLLSRTPRVALFLSKNDPLVMALKQELADHTDEVNLQHEGLNGMFTFYEPTKAQLNIYQVASMTFDLLFLLAAGVYLIVLQYPGHHN